MPVVKLSKDDQGWWNGELKWSPDRTIRYQATTIAALLNGIAAAVRATIDQEREENDERQAS